MRLVYHQIGAGKRISPFDTALHEVSAQAPLLRLASPYIGLGLLQRILDSAHDWRLLSDIEAWLQAGNRKHRAECWAFISENLTRVRHVDALHAKVAVGNQKLFMGSANFTERGVLARPELSILIHDTEIVSEATAWFDTLWNAASAPVLQEGDALVAALDTAEWTTPKVRIKLTSTAPKIASILAETERPEGFDLAGAMAQAGITESRELADLESAFHQISDNWRGSERTFTFKELLVAINQISSGSARDVWHFVTTETANHWLGGLDPSGFDRYVYKEGVFQTFALQADAGLTASLGQVLLFILESLPIYPDRSRLPMENKWSDIGVTESRILPIIELLLGIGLLIEHDIPGEIETYSIDSKFDWPKRWEKFKQAKALFTLRIEALLHVKARSAKDEDNDSDEPDSDLDAALIAKIIQRDMRAEANLLKDETPPEVSPEESARLAEHDRFLAALFEVLAEMPKPLKISYREIAFELKAAGIPHPILSSIQGALKQVKLGLDLNKFWAAEYILRAYPRALASWHKAIGHKNIRR